MQCRYCTHRHGHMAPGGGRSRLMKGGQVATGLHMQGAGEMHARVAPSPAAT